MRAALILNSPEPIENVTESKVIFADGGYKNAAAVKNAEVLGVVGDFDTLDKIPAGEKIVKLEREKNFTDGERAVYFAKECGVTELIVYGATGGRLEHVLGNIRLLKIADKLNIKAIIKYGGNAIELIKGEVNLKVKKGGVVSIFPYGGECTFATSHGLYYPLYNLTLTYADTRGISNVATKDEIYLNANNGEALIIYERN